MSPIITTTLDCGLTVLFEPMPGVRSAALHWLLPVGAAGDPDHRVGESALLDEFTARGAGDMTSREHSDALDRAGIQRASNVGTHHLSISASMLGTRLADALPLLTVIATDLALPEEGLEPARRLCLQAIDSLNDDPQHLAMIRLHEQHLPPPFNRHGYGDPAHLNRITLVELRDGWRTRCVPEGATLGIAGLVEPQTIIEQLNRLCARWSGRAEEIAETGPPRRGIWHSEEPTAQVHLGLAYDAPREADEHAMLERLATAVLSGGASGRLFTEVRERRSLCYSVHAGYSAGRDRGVVTVYAGTTPDRAQETLDLCAAEIRRLSKGVEADEFRRAVIGLKSRLVMHGESTAARAAAITSDHFRLGRARTLTDIAETIDCITHSELNDYVASRDFGEFTVAVIGPQPLNAPA